MNITSIDLTVRKDVEDYLLANSRSIKILDQEGNYSNKQMRDFISHETIENGNKLLYVLLTSQDKNTVVKQIYKKLTNNDVPKSTTTKKVIEAILTFLKVVDPFDNIIELNFQLSIHGEFKR